MQIFIIDSKIINNTGTYLGINTYCVISFGMVTNIRTQDLQAIKQI